MTMLIMADVDPRRPTLTYWLVVRLGLLFDRLFARLHRCAVRGKEILLQHIGEPRNPHAKKPNSSSYVDAGEQGGCNRTDDLRVLRRVEQGS